MYSVERPGTANIRQDDSASELSILLSDARAGQVSTFTGCAPDCDVSVLAADLGQPVRTHVVDLDGNGSRDILVADIGVLAPTNERVGRVLLLEEDEVGGYTTRVLLDDIGRVACAEAADLDNDADLHVIVCEFGDLDGSLLWLEQRVDGSFERYNLDLRPGTIHAYPVDIDDDGDTDIVSVISQLTEEVMLCGIPRGFAYEVLFAAGDPWYGMGSMSSSISMPTAIRTSW